MAEKRLRVALLANWGMGVEALLALLASRQVEVVLVVTQTQKKADDPWFNAVHEEAIKAGLPVMEQSSVKMDWLREHILSERLDMLISCSFRNILPKGVVEAPRLGSMNIHPSLLPKYRGPSPNFWALRNGESRTGLTVHFMDEGVDSGDIICQKEVPILPGDLLGGLVDRIKAEVGPLLTRALSLILDPDFRPRPQNHAEATFFPHHRKA